MRVVGAMGLMLALAITGALIAATTAAQTLTRPTLGQQCGIADIAGGQPVRVPSGAPASPYPAPLAAGDGVIDVSDMQRIASVYGASAPNSRYDGTFDIVAKLGGALLERGYIDIMDVQAVYGRFGWPCVWYPPRFTTSRYVSTLDATRLRTLGCNQAISRESGLVILSFGAATTQSNQLGTLVYGGIGFTPIASIESAAQSFIGGYADCALFLGTGTRITLGVGTTNYGNAVNATHGAAWAGMVTSLRNYLAQRGYTAVVTVAGANDLEGAWSQRRGSACVGGRLQERGRWQRLLQFR